VSAARKLSDVIAAVDRLKATVDLPPEISRTVRLKRNGRIHTGLCPFHGEKTPSFVVYKDHYHCFGCGAHGDLFDWLRHERKLSFEDAVRYLDGGTEHDPQPNVTREQRQREHEARVLAAQEQQQAEARAIWKQSRPFPWTIGERYLTDVRHIPPIEWPDCLRWLPWHGRMVLWEDTDDGPVAHDVWPAGAVVAVATMPDGIVSAVQRIYVDASGQSIRRFDKRKSRHKLTAGTFAGGETVVRLPGDAAGPLQIAEGLETGLTAWRSTAFETWISLGSTADLILPTNRRVVICRDDDPQHSPADKSFVRAQATRREAKINSVVATPWAERRFDKSDFNDLIQVGGCEAVRLRIEAALAPPPNPGNRYSVGHARRVIRAKADTFYDVAHAYDPDGTIPPQTHAMRTDVGSGKSAALRASGANYLKTIRSEKNKSTLVFAVPTHALGEEAALEFEAMPEAGYQLTAEIWRGREAPDPRYIKTTGQTMCQDMDRVRDAQAAGSSVQTACCEAKTLADGVTPAKTNPTAARCPFFTDCSYQRQQHTRADVWFVAHELLFNEKPSAIGKVGALIVDESIWQSGLEGEQGAHIILTLDTLAKPSGLTGTAGQRLDYLRSLALDGVHDSADRMMEMNKDKSECGPILRTPMLDTGLTAETAKEAQLLTLGSRLIPGIG